MKSMRFLKVFAVFCASLAMVFLFYRTAVHYGRLDREAATRHDDGEYETLRGDNLDLPGVMSDPLRARATSQDSPVPVRPYPPIELMSDTVPPLPTLMVVEDSWRALETEWTVSQQPLVDALRYAENDYREHGIIPVIECRGWVEGFNIQLGGGDAGQKSYVAHWNGLPMDFWIYGAGKNAVIPEVGFYRMSGNVDTGGIKHARFVNLTIRNEWSDRCVGSGQQDHQHPWGWGIADFERVVFAGNPDDIAEGRYGGFGKKFGIRVTGALAWRVFKCVEAGSLEHFCYLNIPQPDPRWGGSLFMGNQHLGSTRTMFQMVNRWSENTPLENYTHLLFSDNDAQNIHGDGGGSITVAGGFWGPITIINHRMLNSQHAGVVVWNDSNPTHLTPVHPDGYANGDVYIDGLRFDQGTRVSNQQQVQVNSARSCYIAERWWIHSNKAAFDFSRVGDGPWYQWNGQLSDHPGFVGPGRKVVMDVQGENNRTLTDPEIDALAYPGWN